MRQFGTKIHQNAFGDWTPPDPLEEVESSPRPLTTAGVRGREGERERREEREGEEKKIEKKRAKGEGKYRGICLRQLWGIEALTQ